MESAFFWTKLHETYGVPKSFWDSEEYHSSPGVVDRVIYYLINYFDSPSTARKAVRIFLGIDKKDGSTEYCDWNEVRVATLRELQETLRSAGCTADSLELAVTIKDFLQNAFDTLETTELDPTDLKPTEIVSYLKQLRGIPDAWRKNENSPYRPDTSPFHKQCKRYRKSGEAVIPENVINYIEYLWDRSTQAPFEFHANKVLSRIGLFPDQEKIALKISKFNDLVGDERPINKHRHLVQFSKTICISKPRCEICPLRNECQFKEKSPA